MQRVLTEGEVAPDFTLPGSEGEEIETYSLGDHLDDGVAVLLFYPFDFSPVCTEELCRFRDAGWLRVDGGIDVFGISTDSAHSHRAFAAEQRLPFPLLSDSDGAVSRKYGVLHDEHHGHGRVSRRALFVVDAQGLVRYVWVADDPFEQPSPTLVREAMARVDAVRGQPA